MKNYTANFQIQNVKAQTKPIQVLVNLNTKNSAGKYLFIISNTGLTVNPELWDSKTKRCKPTNLENLTINKKLDIIQNSILQELELYRNMKDENIIAFHEKKEVFHSLINEAITASKTGVSTQDFHNKIMQELSDNAVFPHGKKETTVQDAISILQSKGILPSNFVAENNIYVQPAANRNFTEYWEEKINDWIRQKQIAEDSRRNYTSTINIFKEFEQTYNSKKPILIYELNKKIATDFVVYLTNRPSTVKRFKDEFKGNRLSTISKHKGRFKQILSELQIEDEVELNINLSKKLFRKKTEKTDDVALTEKELSKLYSVDFSKIENTSGWRGKDKFESYAKELEFYRNSFLLAVLSGGCRISDLKRIENIIYDKTTNKYTLKYKSQKVKFDIQIQLPEFYVEIFNKVKNNLHKIKDEKMNKNLKKIGLMAGLTDTVIQELTNPQTNKVFKIKTPLYSLLKSSTARRTLATLMYNKGVAPNYIMQLTGHDNISSLEYYIKKERQVVIMPDIIIV